MSKSHSQMLLAVAILVILYLWWKRKAVVNSTVTYPTVATTAAVMPDGTVQTGPSSDLTNGDQS